MIHSCVCDLSLLSWLSTNDQYIVFGEINHLISFSISSDIEIHHQASLDVDDVIIDIYQEEEEGIVSLYNSISNLT